MNRTARLMTALALALSLCACESQPEQPEDPDAHIPLTTRERVTESLSHLNNESSTERWREHLVSAAAEAPATRAYVLRRCLVALRESYERSGQGPGVLRGDGRRRVMEVAGRVGDGQDARELLRLGLEDALDIRTAAAAGLGGYGEDSAVPVLVRCALEAQPGSVNQQTSLQALRRLATPPRRGLLLSALQTEGRELLKPIVLAAFPEPPADRVAALREVAHSHENPYARAFALEMLVELKDPELKELARRAIDDGHPALRPVALAALGASGGDAAAMELERVLATDPPDADAVARGLYNVGSPRALDTALAVLADAGRRDATRAAVSREFLARLGAEGAAAPYRTPEALRRARDGLREVVEDSDAPAPVVVAAVEALGAMGDPDADVEPLLGLLRSPHPTIGPAVVGALGRLGGDFAAAKLLELIGLDPSLRDAAADALGSFSDPRDVPVSELIDLLESEEPGVRRAALRALLTLSGTRDALGFDPDGTDVARARGLQRWRQWASARGR